MKILVNTLFLGVLLLVTSVQGYDVILKNGKSIHGTKVSEDENMIVVQDASGVRINIKKSNVDADKTETANQQTKTATVEAPEPPASATEQKPPVDPKPVTKKPARKISEEDLEKLREKYDLGEGTFREKSEGSEELEAENEEQGAESSSEKSEAQWHQESEMHRQRVKQAEERYNRLSEQCEQLKKIAVQTHVLVDPQGNELPMQETSQKVCELADSARAKLDEERARYSEFTSEAKQNAVPPGWLRDKEGNDPDE